MTLYPDLESLIGIPYCFEHGPEKLGFIDPWKEGVNCEFLFHLALKLLRDAQLPPSLRSKEIYEPNSWFAEIKSFDTAIIGDAFLFGRLAETDPRRFHLAVLAGESEKPREPLLMHANVVEKTVSAWPLAKFSKYPRYQQLFGIRRLRETP